MCDDEYCKEPSKNSIVEWFKNVLNYTSFGRNKREFSSFERDFTIRVLNFFSEYESSITSWLFKYIDINKVNFVWDYNIHKSGIGGNFTPIRPNTITISDFNNSNVSMKYGLDFEKEDVSGLIMCLSDIKNEKKFKIRYNEINISLCSIIIMNLENIIHEMIHMFQFGIPCRFIEGMTFRDKFLLKVVFPIGYVFNRLITLIIDNPITSYICARIHMMFHPNDIYYNTDDAHIPFLYKFTIEYDVDKIVENNETIKNFSKKLEYAFAGRNFEERENPDIKINNDSYSKKEINCMKKVYNSNIDLYKKQYGEMFWKYAGELYDMCKKERDRIIKLYNL